MRAVAMRRSSRVLLNTSQIDETNTVLSFSRYDTGIWVFLISFRTGMVCQNSGMVFETLIYILIRLRGA